MAQKVNYTPEMTTQIVDAYSAGMDIAEIADSIGKTVRSVRSKLVREGVYVAQPKKVTRKVEGPTKKEILRDLEGTGLQLAHTLRQLVGEGAAAQFGDSDCDGGGGDA